MFYREIFENVIQYNRTRTNSILSFRKKIFYETFFSVFRRLKREDTDGLSFCYYQRHVISQLYNLVPLFIK